MIKPNRLKKGDKVAIVSLSSGILGEPFVKHELDLGIKRLEEYGLIPVFMDNSLKGIDFIKTHPEARAADLKQAFADKSISAIICAIGGNDSYLTLPHLMEDEEFKQLVKNNPKIFLGFSDSTTSHLMLNKLGLITFYGQSFLVDLAEFEENMLEYSKTAFEFLFNPSNNHEIKPSKYWYLDRTDFSPAAVGTLRTKFEDKKGYELLQGKHSATGKLYGGCLEVMAEYLGLASDNKEQVENITLKYNVFPSLEELSGSILLIETSELKISPEEYRKFLKKLKELKVFDVIGGIIASKPIDEINYTEYKQVLTEELKEYDFPVLYNINIGHSYPHTILPLGSTVEIDAENKTLFIKDNPLN